LPIRTTPDFPRHPPHIFSVPGRRTSRPLIRKSCLLLGCLFLDLSLFQVHSVSRDVYRRKPHVGSMLFPLPPARSMIHLVGGSIISRSRSGSLWFFPRFIPHRKASSPCLFRLSSSLKRRPPLTVCCMNSPCPLPFLVAPPPHRINLSL